MKVKVCDEQSKTEDDVGISTSSLVWVCSENKVNMLKKLPTRFAVNTELANA